MIDGLVDTTERDRTEEHAFPHADTDHQLRARALERLTGQDWREHLLDAVLRPLGLYRCWLIAHDRELPEDGACAVQRTDDGVEVEVTGLDPVLLGSAGEPVNTVRDLAALLRALDHGDLLQPASWAATCEPAVPAPPTADYGIAGCGLGVVRLDTACGPACGAAGTVPGCVASASRSPASGLVVAAAAEHRLPFLDMTGAVVSMTEHHLCEESPARPLAGLVRRSGTPLAHPLLSGTVYW